MDSELEVQDQLASAATATATAASPSTAFFMRPSDFLAGTVAGVTGTVIGQPLDLVKTRFQAPGGSRSRSVVRCLIDIARTEGVLSLFKGLAAPVVSLTLMNTVSFGTCLPACLSARLLTRTHTLTGVYNMFKRAIQHALPSSDSPDTTHTPAPPSRLPSIFAGSLTGFMMVPISTPFDMVKIRMQLDNVTSKMFTSSTQCARYLLRHYGIQALYRGTVCNVFREVLFCTIYFGAYESAKDWLAQSAVLQRSGMAAIVPPVVAGALRYTARAPTLTRRYRSLILGVSLARSGMVSWAAIIPIDTVKTRIQSQVDLTPANRVPFRTIVRELARTGGSAFFAGLTPSLVRAMVVSATRFSAYELTQSLFSSTPASSPSSIT